MIKLRTSCVLTLAAVLMSLPAAARAQSGCGPLAPAAGTVVTVTPEQVRELQSILDTARSGDTIQLTDGVYSLPQTLVLRVPGITLRSQSGNRLGVVLDGRYATGDVTLVQRSNVTIADLTLMRSSWHLVHAVPDGSTLSGLTIHNVRGLDGSEQFVKVNPAGEQFADHGVVRCSSFEMTDEGRAAVRNNCYTGGIDIHQALGWQILDNTFSGFWCASGLSEHAIHFWMGSRDTVIERNTVINSARGIGLGLTDSVFGRTYPDAPCAGGANIGNYGGTIANNFVVANDPRLFASGSGFDTGIGIEQSCSTNILHNTVVSTVAPRSSSIEWRFANTSALVANNLMTHGLLRRDNANATLAGNVTDAPLSLFADVSAGNLHLRADATMAIDKGVGLPAPLPSDIDAEPRGVAADVGADEYLPTPAGLEVRLRQLFGRFWSSPQGLFPQNRGK